MGDVGKGLAQAQAAISTGGASLFGSDPGNPLGSLGDFLGTNPGQINTGGFMPSAQEQNFVNALMQRSQGAGGPSPAELQMQQGLNQSNQNAMSLAASQRGINPALAARLASQQQSQNAMQANQQGGILRAQEQLNTDALLGNMFGSQRQSAGAAAGLQANADNAAMGRRLGVISSIGNAAMGMATGGASTAAQGASGAAGGGGGTGYLGANTTFTPAYNKGGQVPEVGGFAEALGSHIANKIMMNGGGQVQEVGGFSQAKDNVMTGPGKVPGKAKVPGDDPKNDTVRALLSPGEVVIPRTVVEMGPEAMAAFAAAVSKGKAA